MAKKSKKGKSKKKVCPDCGDKLLLNMSGEMLICQGCDYEEATVESKNIEPSEKANKAGEGSAEDESQAAEQPEKENSEAGKGASRDEPAGKTELKQPVIKKYDLNHINPGMKMMNSITIYGWRIGHARIRYGMNKPPHYVSIYEQKMTGREAFQLLTQIKRANRQGRIETKDVLK